MELLFHTFFVYWCFYPTQPLVVLQYKGNPVTAICITLPNCFNWLHVKFSSISNMLLSDCSTNPNKANATCIKLTYWILTPGSWSQTRSLSHFESVAKGFTIIFYHYLLQHILYYNRTIWRHGSPRNELKSPSSFLLQSPIKKNEQVSLGRISRWKKPCLATYIFAELQKRYKEVEQCKMVDCVNILNAVLKTDYSHF